MVGTGVCQKVPMVGPKVRRSPEISMDVHFGIGMYWGGGLRKKLESSFAGVLTIVKKELDLARRFVSSDNIELSASDTGNQRPTAARIR